MYKFYHISGNDYIFEKYHVLKQFFSLELSNNIKDDTSRNDKERRYLIDCNQLYNYITFMQFSSSFHCIHTYIYIYIYFKHFQLNTSCYVPFPLLPSSLIFFVELHYIHMHRVIRVLIYRPQINNIKITIDNTLYFLCVWFQEE